MTGNSGALEAALFELEQATRNLAGVSTGDHTELSTALRDRAVAVERLRERLTDPAISATPSHLSRIEACLQGGNAARQALLLQRASLRSRLAESASSAHFAKALSPGSCAGTSHFDIRG